MTPERLVTVKQLSEASPAFTEASLRWLIFNSNANGLDRALLKVGRRVLIDLTEFERWLDEHRVPSHADGNDSQQVA